MNATMMAVLGLMFGGYFIAIGLGRYTPRMKNEPSPEQLKLLRRLAAILGPGFILIAVYNALQALGWWQPLMPTA